MFNFNIIERLKIVFSFGRQRQRGGDAGEIFIAARKIKGTGSIEAKGGDGSQGGKGGKVTLITEDASEFEGTISTEGGHSEKTRAKK